MEFTEPQVPMRPSTPPSRMLDTKMLESPIQVDLPQSIESPAPAQLRQDDTPPLRIFVFDTHRTCGMLFNQLLSAHLGLGAISHPYAFASTVGPERIHTQLQHSERTQILLDAQTASVPPKIASITHQAATENFLRQADRLEQKGKTLFVKENASFVIRPEIMLSALRSHETIISKISNPTVIPDELLGLVTPIVFIRHPAIVIPSWWREVNNQGSCYDLDDEDVTVWTSLRWTRMVFDYLRSSKHMQRSQPLRLQRRNTIASHATTPTAPVVASQPYVIDAADVLDNTHAILSMLCRLLDIDTAILNQAWTPTRRFSSAGESIRAGIAENMMKAFSERLQNTHEPKQNKATSEYKINIDNEMSKWVQEFGQDIAQRLRQRVEQDMPHYHYLRKFRLNARPSLSLSTFTENVSGVPQRRRSAVEADLESTFEKLTIDTNNDRRRSSAVSPTHSPSF